MTSPERKKFSPGAPLEPPSRLELGKLGEQFAAVFFSYNGIDSVNQRDRNVILKEIRRVLRDDGVFVFSSHIWTCGG